MLNTAELKAWPAERLMQYGVRNQLDVFGATVCVMGGLLLKTHALI